MQYIVTPPRRNLIKLAAKSPKQSLLSELNTQQTAQQSLNTKRLLLMALKGNSNQRDLGQLSLSRDH